MAKFVDGEMTVAEAREFDVDDAIERVTGLTLATIRGKLREANGNTKLRNLFRQWPERAEEIGEWTASFALEREVFREISDITGVGPRVVKRRLEEAPHGKQLVQNVFLDEWPCESDEADSKSEPLLLPRRSPRQRSSGGSMEARDVALQPALAEAVANAEIAPHSTMFRRYDLQKARAVPGRRQPAAHQTEALGKLHDWYRSSHSPPRGAILALPTGAGKTFTAVRFLCQEPLSDGYKVLWLAHTHHLLEQAIDAFGPPDGGPTSELQVGHIAGHRAQLDVRVVSATPGHFPISSVSSADDVVIATLQTVVNAYNRGHEKLLAFLDSADGKLVVVFDEAHHAPAPGYSRLLERLREAYPQACILGLTATPTYSDERRKGWLKKLFPQDVLFTVSRSRLIAAGVLSKPHFENRRTELIFELGEAQYERWVSSCGDLPEDVITRLAENRSRNDFIAETYVQGKEKYGKTLIFADRWFQCDYLREALRRRGVRADVVYSHVDARLGGADERNRRSKDENARVLQQFRESELDVLINVRMLTEGTDVPSVSSVFLTRQTTSSILLTQMVGRALRGPAFGGTRDAHIVSFIDNWKEVINFADYEALPVGQADDGPAEYGKRPPLQLISIELVRRLARQMYKGGGAMSAHFMTLLPIGWYSVEYQHRSGDGDDIVWQRHLVMVFENEKGRYDAVIGALADGELTPYEGEALTLEEVRPKLEALKDRFFSVSDDHPGAELLVDLFRIARDMAQSNGDSPRFFSFEERGVHDIDAIARGCIERDLGVRALEDELRAEYGRVDRFWRSLYPNYGLFYAQYQASLRRLLDAELHGVDPERYSGVVLTPQRPPLREPSEAVKAAVFRRDGHRCCCCGATANLEIDHVVPRYLGGPSDVEHLQTLCRLCNSTKAINELNFRTTRTPLSGPSRFVTLPFSAEVDDGSGEFAWIQYVQRSVNFFYRCAAVDTITRSADGGARLVTLQHGLDPTWIEPHLGNFDAHLAELRAAARKADFGKLQVMATA